MKTEDLIHELVARSRPVTPVEAPIVWLVRWATVAAVCVAIGIAAYGVRADFASAMHDSRFTVLTLLSVALTTTAAFAAFEASVPGRDRRWRAAMPVAFGIAAAAVLGMDVASAATLHAGHALGCAGKVFTLSLVPGTFLFVRIRKAAPLDVARTGGLAALSAGALAALAMHVICRDGDPLHVIMGHYLPAAILGGIGIVTGRLLLRWDRR